MKMFEILNINFCEFFGLNQTLLYNKLIKTKNGETKSYLYDEDRAISIFKYVPQDKIFQYRKEKK